ncbi:PhoU domain-containing protein [Chloroflexota bacterium]
MATAKILIVEDDPNLLSTLAYNFDKEGYNAVTAADGAQAIEAARAERPELIILNIATELERIGDYAEGIAKIVVMIGDEPPLKTLVDIPRMADKVAGMLHQSLDALVNHNTDAARQIAAEDDEVDELYDQVFRELLTFMIENPPDHYPGDPASSGWPTTWSAAPTGSPTSANGWST